MFRGKIMKEEQNKKISKLIKDAEYLEKQKNEREIAKKHEANKQKNNKIMLDTLTKITKRKAEEMGKSELLNFYGNNDFEEYFADYVRLVSKNNKLSSKEAIEKLNDDLIKNTNGSFVDSLRDAHNIQMAYITFKNATAFAETKLAKQYGQENYYEMATSKNAAAVKAYNNFQTWAIEKEKSFKDALKLDEEFMKVRTSNNPMQELSKDGILLGAITTICSGIAIFPTFISALLIRDKLKGCGVYLSDIAITTTISTLLVGGGIAIDSYWLKTDGSYFNKINEIADDYGFNDSSSLINYLKTSNYAYLTPDEFSKFEEAYSYNVRELVAKKAGYTNLEEAIEDISQHSQQQIAVRDEVLQNIAQERTLANEMFAKENGFVSYDEVIKYLNNHKILEGEYIHGSDWWSFGEWGAGWSVYAYDVPNAKILAYELTLLDNHYDTLVKQAQASGLYQKVIQYDNAEIAELANNLNAYNSVLTSKFDYLLNSNDLVFYSPDKFSYWAGNEALNLAQDNGFDVITEFKYYWGLKISEDAPPTVENLNNADKFLKTLKNTETSVAEDDIAQNIADNATESVSEIAAGSGLVLGAGLSMALKCNRQIVNAFRQRKTNLQAKEFEKIDTQVKQDERVR